MEWVGAGVLTLVVAALVSMLIWVGLSQGQRTGLWWAASGMAVASDGIVTLAQSPAFLVPFATDAIGPTAAWLFYRGASDFAGRPPRPAAAALALGASAAWLGLHFFGPPGWTYYASASAELPLVAISAMLIYRVAETTMSRLLFASCALPMILVALNPLLKRTIIAPSIWAQIWLAALCPLAIFATCVFLERGMAAKNRALEESRVQLDRYGHQLEELVAKRTAELEASQRSLRKSERLASIGTLTAGLAHQVNNPVGSIMAAAGFARQCRGDAGEFETLRQAVADIEKEAARCGEIVRDMLRFASDRPTDKKELPIDPILVRVRDVVRRLERERGAHVTLRLEGPSPVVRANPIEIEQALTNVIENAIQSRASGAQVSLEREVLEGQVRITIQDDGRGIAAEDLGYVLDPFFTSRLESGGTGLGLSVAHGIADEHEGSIEVDSEPGRGTVVVVNIPTVG